jgi:pimeloyl-ACP methyl ester carboxylesterase
MARQKTLRPVAGFTQVGALRIYHETMGRGQPLLLLHSGFMSIAASYPELRPRLALHAKTFAPEQQAHGHTPDIDRPLRYEQMVEDTAAVLKTQGLRGMNVFGWSDGGVVALGLAIRYPRLVERVAIAGSGYNQSGGGPPFARILRHMPPDNPHLREARLHYEKVAPNPAGWPALVQKVKQMYFSFQGWPEAKLRKLRAPLLVMVGDHDFIRVEHALKLSRLVPQGQLAVIPGADHGFPTAQWELLATLLERFFGSPV